MYYMMTKLWLYQQSSLPCVIVRDGVISNTNQSEKKVTPTLASTTHRHNNIHYCYSTLTDYCQNISSQPDRCCLIQYNFPFQ